MKRSKVTLVGAAHGVAVLLFMGSVMTSRLPAQATPPAQTGKQLVPANPLNPAAPAQPLPFSHKAHSGLPGLECQTCHTNPAPGSLMSFPATSTCMKCHATVAAKQPSIQKLAQYAKSKTPVPWVRVYTIRPSHVGEVHEAYERSGVPWSHGKHLAAGLTCEACHGPVAAMDALAEVTSAASKGGCLTCHSPRAAAAANKPIPTTCVTCHAFYLNDREPDWRGQGRPRR